MSSPATHLRAPLLWLLVPFAAGIGAARLCPLPSCGLSPLLLGAGALAALAAVAGWRDRAASRIVWSGALAAAAALAGFAHLHAREPGWHLREGRPPREATLTVRVTRVYPAAAKSRSVAGIGEIVAAAYPGVEGAMVGRRVYFSAIRRVSVAPRASGRYDIRGVIDELDPEPADHGFDAYLADLGVGHRILRARILREVAPPGAGAAALARVHSRLAVVLRLGLEHEPGIASIYAGMLLGEKANLSPEQQAAFLRSGTFHLFSISGLHVGVIAAAIQGVLWLLRVPRRAAGVACLAVLGAYVAVTGASPPAIRALLMIACLLASQLCRLPGNALSALAASALLILLFDPVQLFGIGFQMSYTVVAALVLMGAPLAEKWTAAWRPFALLPRGDWRWRHHAIAWLGRHVLGGAAGCWVAFLASTPAGIDSFRLFSPGSLAANLVVIPLSSLAIIAGLLSLLSGLAGCLPWAVLFNSAAGVILLAIDALLRHGTQLPGACFPATFRYDWLSAAAPPLLLGVMLAGRAGRWSRRYGGFWPPVAVLGAILLAGVRFG
jgi:competence protein ComEC